MIVTPPGGPGRGEVNFKESYQDNFSKLRISLSHPQYTLRSSYFDLNQYLSVQLGGGALIEPYDPAFGYRLGPGVPSTAVYGIIQTNQRIASGNLNSGTFIFQAEMTVYSKISYKAGLFTNVPQQTLAVSDYPYGLRYGFWFESRSANDPEIGLLPACAAKIKVGKPTVYINAYQRATEANGLGEEIPEGIARVPRACWNIDPLDGTGESTKLVDFGLSQNLVIDFSLSSQGIVRYGVLIEGVIYFCHFVALNGKTQLGSEQVNFFIPNLPLRYEFENTEEILLSDLDPSIALNAKFNASYFIENGVSNFTSSVTERLYSSPLAVIAGTKVVLLAVRLRIANSITDDRRDAIAKLLDASIQCIGGTTDFQWTLYLNPEIAGTLTFTDIPGSVLQECTTSVTTDVVSLAPPPVWGTVTVTKVIDSGYATGTANLSFCELSKNICYIGAGIDAALTNGASIPVDVYGDTLILAVEPRVNASFVGSITMREIF